MKLLESRQNTNQTHNANTHGTSSIVHGKERSIASVAQRPQMKTYAAISTLQEKAENAASEDASNSDPVINEMLNILSILKAIKVKFTSCTTMMDKVIIVLSHLGKYV